MSNKSSYGEKLCADVWESLPIDWSVHKLKHVADLQLSNVDKHTVEGQTLVALCNYTDVYNNERITSDFDFMQASATDEQIKRLSLKKQDVLLTKDSETPDDIGIPALVDENLDGVVCGYHLALARPDRNQLIGAFLFRVIQSQPIKRYYFCRAVGMTRYGLDKQSISETPVVIPPIEAQKAIADYLDEKTAVIDHLITAKERLLTLLDEKRRALITHAVTRGLDSAVPLRDSGVEWIGRVPEHWEIASIKYTAEVGNGSTPKRDNKDYWDNGTFPWLTSTVVNDNIVQEPTQFVTELALRECHLPIVPARSVLVAITGQGKTRGNAALLPYQATINQHMVYISPRQRILNPEYLNNYLFGVYEVLRMISEGSGSTRGAITVQQIAEFPILLPPLAEQQEIVHYLEQETAKLDNLKQALQKTIVLLQERRTALIAAAVSGQHPVADQS